MTFALALPHILKYEGGFVNNPNDPGGATNKGVTQKTFTAWLAARGYPHKDVRHITDQEVGLIYHQNYWLPCGADHLSQDLRLIHFDCAVNCGVTTAIRMLQEAAGATVDGKIGPATIAAIMAVPTSKLRDDYLWLRARYYARITVKNPKLREFMQGWILRLIAVRSAR